jgi:hypothetical protein
MKFFLAIIALFLGTTVQAQLPYTLNLADGTTTVASPHRAGINLASLNYYDNGQLYKNLVAQDNFGFENTLTQQIWALTKSGSTTTFCNTNQYAVYPVNFWAGATVSVVESSGAEAGYVGTVASNTAGGPACYTVATPAPAAFSAGDEIIVTLNQFPTAESCWETSTNCGIWTDIQNGGKLLTDSTTPYDGKQSLILDATASPNAVAGASLYFDSDSQNHFIVMNGAYEISGWMKTGSIANNHVLTVCAGRTGNQQCKNVTPTANWTRFSVSISLNESNTTQNSANVTAYISGANGLGQVEVDDLSFVKTSGQDPTNTSVFRDEFVAALRQYCATETTGPSCLIRNWTNQNAETMANWTAPQSAAMETIASAGAPTYGEITPRLLDYLNLVKLVGGVPYFVEPVTFQGSDPANLVEYLASTNTGSGYGQIRANQGQIEPWVGTGGVFSDVYISFCNECWNDSSFSGQALPWRSAEANDYYHDYWNRAKDVFAAMRADSAFTSNIHLGFNLQLGVNYAPGGLDKALRGMAAVGGAADYVEQAPYQQSVVSNWKSDSALWGSAMEQPWDDAANPLSLSGYYQAVKAIQGYKLCGQNGKQACFATDYEQANNTLATCGVAGWAGCNGITSAAIDQTHEDRINAGAGQGIIAPLQVALNQSRLGVTAQNYFGATEFSNGTLSGMSAKISKLWGLCVDYGGATSYLNGESYSCRPQFLGMSVLNQAIIGPEYSCSLAAGPSYIWLGSLLNGPTAPALGVPYVHPFCFKGGSENPNQRAIVLFNTNLTSSYSINFAGTNVPSGTCSVQQYAPSSPDLLNESPSGTATNTTPATTSISSASATCGSTVTLPPDSETAITFTVGGVTPTATPTFTPASGNYSTAQTVTLADSTSGAKIYYTLDGSTPTTSSNLYSAAIQVSSSETLKAVAIASNYSVSSAASATYTITTSSSAATTAPVFSLRAGTYSAAQNVSISAASGSQIYYTTNGSAPTKSSTKYTSLIAIKATATLRAVAVTAKSTSAVTAATYVIEPTIAAPVFSIPAGTYSSEQVVKITAASGSLVYYTTNGSTPTTSSPRYAGSVTINASATLRAIAVSGKSTSAVTAATYVIETSASAPEFSVPAGTYSTVQNVKIIAASGASVYYTTNGSAPTTSAVKYKGLIAIKATATLRAIAVIGKKTSSMTSATYTIVSLSAAPKISIPSGTYSATQNVKITAPTGSEIYYTTNGSTPSTSSVKYAGLIAIKASSTLHAIAVNGKTRSAVASASYVIAAAAPTFVQKAGSYATAINVQLADETPDVVIHYTLNGKTPDASSPVYDGFVAVSSSATLKAIAIKSGLAKSAVATASYTIKPYTATPAFGRTSGTYRGTQTETISDATPGAVIYYTTNQSTPTTASKRYTGPFSVSGSEYIQAIAVAPEHSASFIGAANLQINQ